MNIHFEPLDQDFVKRVRAGGPDAYGNPAERVISDGDGKPCRCCLGTVPIGEGMLILAARPFPGKQPYAETGPIFLCEKNCLPWEGEGVPPVLTTSPDYLVKGYSKDDRIVYGSGQVTKGPDIPGYAETLFGDERVAYVDIRSARNNCFLTRTRRPAA